MFPLKNTWKISTIDLVCKRRDDGLKALTFERLDKR